MEPLRIAMVTTFYPPYNFGGDGIYVQRLARALSARGHHVEVIHDTDAYRSLTGREPAGQNTETFPVHALRSGHPVWSALKVQQLGRPATHRAELQALLSDRFDVINFHNVSLIGGPGVWALGDAVKLHTAHEHWLVCPSHVLWRYNREICDERRCLRCVLRYKRPPQIWRATDLMAKMADHVDVFMTFSESAAENHRRFGFARPMEVVPSFYPSPETIDRGPEPPGRPYFAFVGRLEKIKGLQDVIPLFDDDLGADLLIAGRGEYEAELRRLAAGRPAVRFLGQKSKDELAPLYRGALAAIAPSQCYEVFPLVVLEAFCEGTPVVARDLGPYPEIIHSTGGGVLFREKSDLRDTLKRLLDDRASARAMGTKARAAFVGSWTEEVALARYFDIIETAAHRKGAASLMKKFARAGLRADPSAGDPNRAAGP